jgi:hypothetical protein
MSEKHFADTVVVMKKDAGFVLIAALLILMVVSGILLALETSTTLAAMIARNHFFLIRNNASARNLVNQLIEEGFRYDQHCRIGLHGTSWYLGKSNEWWHSMNVCSSEEDGRRFQYVVTALQADPCLRYRDQAVSRWQVVFHLDTATPVIAQAYIASSSKGVEKCSKNPRSLRVLPKVVVIL